MSYGTAGLHKVAGIGQTKMFDLRGRDPLKLTEGELDLLIARDRAYTQKAITESIRGIGSLQAERYQDSIDMIDDALETLNNAKVGAIDNEEKELEMEVIADMAVNGVYSIAGEIYGFGIGEIAGRKKRKKRRAKRKARRKAIRKIKKSTPKGKARRKAVRAYKRKNPTKTGKFLRKAAKATAKVITFPVRTVAKGVLEVSLPKAAPFFLYLFINDPVAINKLPAHVRAKRKKQERIANFIVKKIGMKRKHFMGIVRNGIMKQTKKSPEKNIEILMNKYNVSGIGELEAIFELLKKISQIIKPLTDILRKLGGKSKANKNDAPSINDWNNIPDKQKQEINNTIKSQTESGSFETGGKSFWNSLS